LEQAITDWILETEEGKEAWAESCEDFNIGDVLMHYPSESLTRYLRKRGVNVLSLEQATTADVVSFDRILVDTARLESEEPS
jgi:predicted Fe-Mo cluster-binding NifX family protein